MPLVFRQHMALPRHAAGGFDHGDVHLASGLVYVAHTATGCIEIVDGERGVHLASVPGYPEASGVLCAQDDDLVFAAARGAGTVLALHAATGKLLGDLRVGPKPNGLAWDTRRKRLLGADVQDFQVRLLDVDTGDTLAAVALPGRPRWCIYDAHRDRFLINIREPACVAVLAAATAAEAARIPISSAGPHGLDLDPEGGRAFVACDGGKVVVLDLETDRELTSIPIAGEPDAIWYNPHRQRLYVAIGTPGVLDVVDCRRMRVDEQIITESGAHTTAYDDRRQQLYVFLPRSCRAAVYEEG
jgi:hypothetical protein